MTSEDILERFELELEDASFDPLQGSYLEPRIEKLIKLSQANEETKGSLVKDMLKLELAARYEIFDIIGRSAYDREGLRPYAAVIDEVFEETERPSAQISDYEFQELINEGGFGWVYKAVKKSTGMVVAVKIMKNQDWGPAARKRWVRRFIKEARAVVNLDIAGIAQVYDIGVIDPDQKHPLTGGPQLKQRSYFYVMKYAGGQNLRERLDLPLRTLVDIIATVARTIHQVHSKKNIVHRDLKPANIVLDQKTPTVVDFGLARFDTQSTSGQSQTAGTMAYMSPEQCYSHLGDPTPRTDVYGLGGILYTALTKALPFEGKPAEIYLQIREGLPEARYPRKLNPSIDAELERICLKCLAPKPELRYESAEGVRIDLLKWKKDVAPSPDIDEPSQLQSSQTLAPTSGFGLGRFTQEATVWTNELLGKLRDVENGVSTEPILLDSNKCCEMAYRNGIVEVRDRFWTLSNWDWRFWLGDMATLYTKSHSMLERLKNQHAAEKLAEKSRLLFFTRGELQTDMDRLRLRLEHGDAKAVKLEHKLMNDRLAALKQKGCTVKICKLDLRSDERSTAAYTKAVAGCGAGLETGWTVFDDARVDFFRISSYGEFHDLRIVCQPMAKFDGLPEAILPYFETWWDDATPWEKHWENLYAVLDQFGNHREKQNDADFHVKTPLS